MSDKYYVYSIHGEKSSKADGLFFAKESQIAHFAETKFNPAFMSFTGIMIEAESTQDALETFYNPSHTQTEYFICDEPTETSSLRFKKNDNFEDLVRNVSAGFIVMNNAMSIIADLLYEQSNKPDGLSPAHFFELIKNMMISSLKYKNESK